MSDEYLDGILAKTAERDRSPMTTPTEADRNARAEEIRASLDGLADAQVRRVDVETLRFLLAENARQAAEIVELKVALHDTKEGAAGTDEANVELITHQANELATLKAERVELVEYVGRNLPARDEFSRAKAINWVEAFDRSRS